MDNKVNDMIKKEELEHLDYIQGVISKQLDEVENSLEKAKEGIIEQKRYLWENIYELDPEEIASNRLSISEEHDSYEMRDNKRRLLMKQKENPYFGRIDFVYEGEDEAEILYIGLGGLQEKGNISNLIYDWRAPISSMYYDFDTGKAFYEAPMGMIDGEITQKRQLKIRKGVLEYAIQSNFNIDDEILQKELSGNGSTKMRNIVATIQKEQNSIVRDQLSNVMVVQGVAGSGKTSIALHRIAFLLYQNRNNLKSSEVLIISPNTIFSDYISNVLPELGEQNITEVSFDEIAEHEMKGISKYEKKYKQMEYVIHCQEDDERLKSIRLKSGAAFLKELKEFVKELEDTLFEFSPYSLNGELTEGTWIEELYSGTMLAKYPVFVRLDHIADRIADIYESNNGAVISISSRNEIKKNLKDMAKTKNIMELYEQFIAKVRLKYPECQAFGLSSNNNVPYEDVFPIILLKFLLFGNERSYFERMKHVIVDEMQDYSMVQYEILNNLFKCKMTILGDINQVVDRNNATLIDNLEEIFGEKATLVKMMKSYRSTFEISEFCRKMCSLSDAESFERHGEMPSIEEYDDYNSMINSIQEKMDRVDLSVTTTMVVICKTASAADGLYAALDDEHKEKCYLMNDENSNFHEGIIITNAYLVKGLEFDYVIVPSVVAEEYHSERDRQILYIAGTRALHKLDIMYYGNRSLFIDDALR